MAAFNTYSLTASIAGTDVTAQINNLRITTAPAESDFTSFLDAAAGGAREYRLQGTAVQDPATGSIWQKIWSAAGTTVPVVLRPNGGTTASATQPTYSGNVTIVEADGDLVGGESNASRTSKFTVEVNFPFAAKPIMAVA